MKVSKDGRSWQIGTFREVAWIVDGTTDDLFFPDDRSRLVSALWDDTWTCIGGPHTLIEALQHDPLVEAYRVQLGVDAKPPGRDRDYRDRDDETPTEPNPGMPEWYRDT